MNKVTELIDDYVSFELAKQLKEKGFPQKIYDGNFFMMKMAENNFFHHYLK